MKCNYEFCAEYINTWIDAMLDSNNVLLSAWYGLHDWTKAHMANVLYPLAERLGYYNKYGTGFQQEYYNVDFTLYNYREQSVWSLDYAVEHENDEFILKDGKISQKGWFDEFAKLLPLKCAKARVIIGYDRFKDKNLFEAKLERCHELLTNDYVKPSLADSSIFLIIFPRTEYIKAGNYYNGLMHIIHFYNDNGEWEMEKDLTDKICNTDMLEKLKSIYKKIAEKY